MTYVKPRQYGEPIHEDAPGFDPRVHRDLVEEVNEVIYGVSVNAAGPTLVKSGSTPPVETALQKNPVAVNGGGFSTTMYIDVTPTRELQLIGIRSRFDHNGFTAEIYNNKTQARLAVGAASTAANSDGYYSSRFSDPLTLLANNSYRIGIVAASGNIMHSGNDTTSTFPYMTIGGGAYYGTAPYPNSYIGGYRPAFEFLVLDSSTGVEVTGLPAGLTAPATSRDMGKAGSIVTVVDASGAVMCAAWGYNGDKFTYSKPNKVTLPPRVVYENSTLIGPESAKSDQYDYRQVGDEIQFYDHTLNIWRTMGRSAMSRPMYMVLVSFTNNYSGMANQRGSVSLVTDKARPDGADIRVFRKASNGNPEALIPHIIPSIVNRGSMYTYNIQIGLSMGVGELAEFYVTYGDPDAVPATFTAAQYNAILDKPKNVDILGPYAIYQDRNQAYVPADFSTGGYQLYGNRDDTANEAPTPLNTEIIYGSGVYKVIGHNPNGGWTFGGVDNNRPSQMPNAIGWCSGDIYETWRREVVLPDGFAWHILTGASGYTSDIKLTIRYYNTGRIVVTMFNHRRGDHTRRINVRYNGGELAYQAPTEIIESEPSSWLTVVLDTGLMVGTVGKEERYVGQITPYAGVRPITSDMIYTPYGSLDVQMEQVMKVAKRGSVEPAANWFLGGR